MRFRTRLAEHIVRSEVIEAIIATTTARVNTCVFIVLLSFLERRPVTTYEGPQPRMIKYARAPRVLSSVYFNSSIFREIAGMVRDRLAALGSPWVSGCTFV